MSAIPKDFAELFREDDKKPVDVVLYYDDIHVVETLEEAREFRYEHNDEPVEIGTPVGFDKTMPSGALAPGAIPDIYLVCFKGIYFQGLKDTTNSYPRGDVDFGTSME